MLLSAPLRVFLSSIQATPAKNKHNVYSSKDKVFLTFKASFVEAAPPGKIFSIFITGWTLDSIPPDILIPAIKQNIAVEKTLRGCVTVLHYSFLILSNLRLTRPAPSANRGIEGFHFHIDCYESYNTHSRMWGV